MVPFTGCEFVGVPQGWRQCSRGSRWPPASPGLFQGAPAGHQTSGGSPTTTCWRWGIFRFQWILNSTKLKQLIINFCNTRWQEWWISKTKHMTYFVSISCKIKFKISLVWKHWGSTVIYTYSEHTYYEFILLVKWFSFPLTSKYEHCVYT